MWLPIKRRMKLEPYNIYLLVAGAIAAGLPIVQELIFRPETNQEFKYFLVGLSGIVLVFIGLLSVGFFTDDFSNWQMSGLKISTL